MSSNKAHVMIDIETLDTERTAVILSLGAVVMNTTHEDTFYEEFDSTTQVARTESESTLQWWREQTTPRPAGKVQLIEGLQKFKLWLSTLRAEPIIWCKGTDFDVAILANAYTQFGFQVPWKYNNVRDMRTLKKLHPQLTYATNHEPHHALQDAINQAVHLSQIFAYNRQLQWE